MPLRFLSTHAPHQPSTYRPPFQCARLERLTHKTPFPGPFAIQHLFSRQTALADDGCIRRRRSIWRQQQNALSSTISRCSQTPDKRFLCRNVFIWLRTMIITNWKEHLSVTLPPRHSTHTHTQQTARSWMKNICNGQIQIFSHAKPLAIQYIFFC